MPEKEIDEAGIISFETEDSSCNFGYKTTAFHLVDDEGKDRDYSFCSEYQDLRANLKVFKAGLKALYPGRVFFDNDKGETVE